MRINSGGVKLSKADLLFSTVVSEWETGREKIDELIKEVKKNGFEIDSDFVMRTCLYLTYSPILFKVDTFNDKTIHKIISLFNSTEERIGIYDTVIQTFQFLKMKLGLTDKMLKSTNVVIPVIHHLFHGGKLGDESVEEVQKFIYISLLQKTFGSHGDTLLKDLREGVSADESFQLKNAAFSYAKIISKIGEDTKRYLYNVNIAWAEKLLTTKYGADAWLILSLIYGSLRYEYQSYDQDHLHPRSKFTNKNYPGDLKAIADKIDAIPSLTFSTPEENRLDKKAHSLKAYVDEILPVRNPEWLAQYRTFNKIDETSSLELADFPAFFETRRQKMLNILVDKLQLNANAPEPEPDPEDVYIDEPDEVLEAMEEFAPVEEADRREELEDGIADTTENRRPPGYIAETTLAILRCATKINASVPSRIVEADLTLYQRKGIVALQFNYANYNYVFEVPFTRPYLNKEAGTFANLLNLNQSRTQNNQQFQALIERITNQYTANPAIEIVCQIQLVRNEEVR